MAEESSLGKVIYAFGSSAEGNLNPCSESLESLKEHKFLRYLFGTSKEMEGVDRLEKQVADFRKNIENKDWLLVNRNGLDLLRLAQEALDEYQQATEDVDKLRFDLEYHGTIAYILASVPLAILAPLVGVPLFIDSTVRTSRMAFRSDAPVGLVGTIRETYQHLKNQ